MPYWMWIGNQSQQYNATPATNLTASERASIVGYTATGPDELQATMMNGQILGGSFQTTFNTNYGIGSGNGGTRMNYNTDDTGNVTDARITTAVQAQFRITDMDANGNEFVVGTYTGLFVQMNNGDVFFRPVPTTVTQWETEVARIYSIEVISTTPIADDTAINSVIGFNPSIVDVEIIPCFTAGTLILTNDGLVPVEELKVGDLVMTVDRGLQPIRWVGRRKLTAATLAEKPQLRPIRIAAGALGKNIPENDLIVSPQHRILVRSKVALRIFDTMEVLVAAKQLLQVDGVDIATDLIEADYLHLLFDHHEVVLSNGAETESLYTGPEALKSVGLKAKEEIFSIFPELAERDYKPESARLLASGRMARKLAIRHIENRKPLIAKPAHSGLGVKSPNQVGRIEDEPAWL